MINYIQFYVEIDPPTHIEESPTSGTTPHIGWPSSPDLLGPGLHGRSKGSKHTSASPHLPPIIKSSSRKSSHALGSSDPEEIAFKDAGKLSTSNIHHQSSSSINNNHHQLNSDSVYGEYITSRNKYRSKSSSSQIHSLPYFLDVKLILTVVVILLCLLHSNHFICLP